MTVNHSCAWLLLFVLIPFSNACFADPVGFRFSAQPIQGGTIFGETISVLDRIDGFVIYDTSSQETNQPTNCLDCSGFRQDIVAGFFIEVGSLALWSNSYLASVFNDEDGALLGPIEDALTFEHSPGLSPPLLSNLLVNGVPSQEGTIALSLMAFATEFNNSDLPLSPTPADFPISNLLISDGSTDSPLIGSLLGVFDSSGLQRFEVIEGDYDFDGAVTLQDFELWRANFGSNASPLGDGNGDGQIDAADFTIWRDAFHESSTIANGSTVPEPLCAIVCLQVLAAGWLSRGRIRSNA